MKDCNTDQIRNPGTGRCVLKRSPLGKKILEAGKRTIPRRVGGPRRVSSPRRVNKKKEKKPCNSDQIRNPGTGRCVLKRSPLGKKILEKIADKRTSPRRATTPRRVSTPRIASTPRRASTPAIQKKKEQKPCNSDQIRNPGTGRCVLKRSPLGKKILGKKKILISTPGRLSKPKRVLDPNNDKDVLLTVLKKDYATKTIFDESYINRVFGLLYLSYKFRDQCIIIKPQKNYFESKMLKGNYTDYVYLKYYEKNDDFNYIPDEFWNKIEDCMADKKRFIIIRIGIYFSKGAHANLLIYDTVNKSLERFEPHGAYHDYEKIYQNIDKKILQLFKLNLGPSYVKNYYKPLDYCPMKIFQALEKYSNKQGDPGGFCAVWCLWYADLRLANPDLSRDQLVDKAIAEIGKTGDFKQFIRNYSHFIATLRKKLKNTADPMKELEKMFDKK